MAQLQCLSSIKERRRVPSTAAVAAQLEALSPPPRQRQIRADTLYDIEVIEEDGPRVKVHYIGYDSTYDEWKLKEEIALRAAKPTTDFHPFTELACQIKRKLHPSRHEDPGVRLQVPTTKEAQLGTPKGKVYTINAYEDLSPILGDKWHLRITNRNGDFSYVVLSTVQFHLTNPRCLMEYEPQTHSDGTVTFEPMYVEQCCTITFKFVRGDGNKHQFHSFV